MAEAEKQSGDNRKDATQGGRGDAEAQPSGTPSENKSHRPATAGQGESKGKTGPAEQADGRPNPSSPGDTGTTPGTNAPVG